MESLPDDGAVVVVSIDGLPKSIEPAVDALSRFPRLSFNHSVESWSGLERLMPNLTRLSMAEGTAKTRREWPGLIAVARNLQILSLGVGWAPTDEELSRLQLDAIALCSGKFETAHFLESPRYVRLDGVRLAREGDGVGMPRAEHCSLRVRNMEGGDLEEIIAPRLRVLTLEGYPSTRKIPKLSTPSLLQLMVSMMPAVSDISPIAGLPIERLGLFQLNRNIDVAHIKRIMTLQQIALRVGTEKRTQQMLDDIGVPVPKEGTFDTHILDRALS